MQVIAFSIGVLVFTGWALADLRPAVAARLRPWQPYALGAVIVSTSLASANGGALIYLGMAAALMAATQDGLATTWTVVGLGVLTAIVAGLAVGASAWVIIANVSGLLILMLLGRNRRSARVQAEQAAALLAKAEQLQDEHARVATLDERTRIAREIHDVLAHSLGALGVQIQVARAVLTDQNDVPRAVEVLDQAHRMAIDGLAETRRAVYALRGDTLPLPAGLAQLSADHQRQHGAPVTFGVSGEPRPLTPDAGLAITRTAQEALINTAKHAPHQPVDIRLDYAAADTSLRVTNQLSEDDHAAATGPRGHRAGHGERPVRAGRDAGAAAAAGRHAERRPLMAAPGWSKRGSRNDRATAHRRRRRPGQRAGRAGRAARPAARHRGGRGRGQRRGSPGPGGRAKA